MLEALKECRPCLLEIQMCPGCLKEVYVSCRCRRPNYLKGKEQAEKGIV